MRFRAALDNRAAGYTQLARRSAAVLLDAGSRVVMCGCRQDASLGTINAALCKKRVVSHTSATYNAVGVRRQRLSRA